MRQQFAPLMWCLLISLLLAFQVNAASFKTTRYTSETSLNKEVLKDYIQYDLAVEHLDKSKTKVKETSNNTNSFLADTEMSFKNDNRLSSEFSYNFVAPVVVNYSPISKKILATTFQYSENPKTIFYQGIFYGFALMALLLNVVCYFIFEEKLFLYFSGAIITLTSVLFYNDGLLNLLGVDMMADSQLVKASILFVSVAITTLFAYRFLSIKDFFPKLKGLSYALLGIALVLLASAWISKNTLLASLSNTSLFTLLISYFIAGALLFNKKNYARFFVIAFAVPLLFSIDFFVFKSFGASFLFTGPIHMKVAVVLEVILLSYGIIYRMKAIKDEIELRQTEMRIFIKKQEMMNRENITNLMKDVYLENLIMQHDLDGLEIKLLQYISEGVENPKIARKLKMTETNVEELTNELYEKLEIREQVKADHRMIETQPDYIYN